jgi:hypothetical protein
MPNGRNRAKAAIAVLALPAVLNTAQAHAAPLPDFCAPQSVVDDVCSVRLASVTANAVDGTITGAPVGGGTTITLAGQGDAYLKSAGFGDAPPDTVRQWDDTIDNVNGLNVDSSNPNWYGNAKAKVFLPRTLNELASRFPDDILVVGFTTSDDGQSDTFQLKTIQPTTSNATLPAS